MTTYTAAGAVAAYQSGTRTVLNVVDSGADIMANITGLEAIATASRQGLTLTQTDPSTPITVTGAVYHTDLYALSVTGGSYQVVVTDASASTAGIYYGTHLQSVSMVDSAANIGANLGNIHLMNIENVPYTVTLTDSGPVHFNNVSVNDWEFNSTVFAHIQGSNFTVSLAGAVPANSISGIPGLSYISSVSVSDSATGIGAGLDALEAVITAHKLGSLTMTGGTATAIPIKLAQITSDADVLALLPSGYKLAVSTDAAHAASAAALPNVSTVTVTDTGANLSASLDALQTLVTSGKVSAITQSDYSGGLMTLTEAQVTNDAQALAKFTTYYGLIEVVPAADAGTAIVQPNVYGIEIADTAANISANITTIRTLATNLKVNSISVTDGGTIQVTYDQYNTQSNWRYFLQGNYGIAISGVNYYSMTTPLHDAHVVSLGIVTTSSDISYELDTLEIYAKAGKISSISFSDGGTPTLSLSGAQAAADADVLRLLPGSSYSANGVSVAGAQAALSGNVSTISISDTAANLSAGLTSVESLVASGKVTAITVTDGGTLSLTQAQISGAAQMLAKMSGPYHLILQNVSAASSALAGVSGHVQSATVIDSAANVSANMSALQSLATAHALTSITLTDSGTPTLTLTGPVLDSSPNALSLVVGNYKVVGTALSVNTAYELTNSGHLTSATIADSAVHVGIFIDDIQVFVANGSVSNIALTDSGTSTVYVTEAQLTSDAQALQDITTPHNLAIYKASAADSASLLAKSGVVSIAVSDKAANISANLDALQTVFNTGKITQVEISDSGILTMSVAQQTADASLLHAIGYYQVSLQGVSAAAALSTFNGSNVRSVGVTDSAINVVAHLSDLENLAKYGELTSITLTDSGVPLLQLTSAQLTADAQALNAITSPYTLSPTGLTVSQFNDQVGGGHATAASIADSAANVAAALDALAGDVQNGSLTSIALTDMGTASLSLTEAQFNKDVAALQIIVGNHTLQISQAGAGDAATLAAMQNVGKVGVSDTAANVTANLDMLQSLLSTGKLNGIAITDDGSLTVSAAQMISDAQAINDIAGNYSLHVTDATLASLSPTVLAHAAALSVHDSGANISSNLDTLQSVAAAGKLTGVTITDSGFSTIAVSASQLISDAQALNALSGNFIVKIDTSAANLTLSGLADHGNVASFSGAASEYSITPGSNGTVTITDTGTGRSSTDHLSGLTAIQFGDHTDIVAQAPGTSTVTTGNVTELYGAVFGRLPDVPGLNYYEQDLQANPNLPLTTFAQWFLASPEYTNNPAHNYAQTSTGDAQFITDSYTNLLGRAPEAAAVPYYQNIINFFTQGLTPGTAAYQAALNVGHSVVLTDFSASSEFLGDVTVTAQNPSSTQHWLLLTS